MLQIQMANGGVLYLLKMQDTILICPIGVKGMQASQGTLGEVFAELLESFEDSETLTVAGLMNQIRDADPLPYRIAA